MSAFIDIMPPQNRSSRLSLLAALMASAFLATACGGGEDSEIAATAAGNGQETAQAISPTSSGTWTRVASEYAYFKLATRSFVRYGSGSNWVGKYVEAGSAQCANDFFGSDPAVGVTKVCEVYAADTAPAPVAPAPSPAPAPAPAPSPAPAPAPAATGSALLTWNAPTGSVQGYRVYYGTSSRSYAQEKGQGLFVTNTTVSVPNLDRGTTYYFAVTAVAAGGAESTYSSEATKAIP
ncbi:fibronectin type III domain-containing protein [uncultured Azohydromonas sp.]|jgi:Fibronectin type III domain.|uniref:fibronectin type III domain-containing protein n=1 Tax=uncultured Azohydromonas sp. TaxID=487342 RepID=UPI00261BE841|nr:fibronectin type III domain-containing protein [uncultured Azohydromonas sp.]